MRVAEKVIGHLACVQPCKCLEKVNLNGGMKSLKQPIYKSAGKGKKIVNKVGFRVKVRKVIARRVIEKHTKKTRQIII
jgi:hypothetical protein